MDLIVFIGAYFCSYLLFYFFILSFYYYFYEFLKRTPSFYYDLPQKSLTVLSSNQWDRFVIECPCPLSSSVTWFFVVVWLASKFILCVIIGYFCSIIVFSLCVYIYFLYICVLFYFHVHGQWIFIIFFMSRLVCSASLIFCNCTIEFILLIHLFIELNLKKMRYSSIELKLLKHRWFMH